MPTKLWDRTFGGSEIEYLTTTLQTRDGGYIIGGTSDSDISGDKTQSSQGTRDYWLVKIDANGDKEWDRTFGGSSFNALESLQQTSDGGYILGGTSDSGISGDKTQPSRGDKDYWLVKISATGTKQWDRTFGGSNYDYLGVVQQTSDGGYLLGGDSTSPLSGEKTQTGRGSFDYWVVKVDANGAKQWDQCFGGSGADHLYAMHQTRGGGYILGGYSDSGIGGDKTQSIKGGNDYWLVKLDANGTKEWDQSYGGSSDDNLKTMQQTREGGYILGGYSESGISGEKTQPSQGEGDYWLVKVDANGTKQWDQSYGGSRFDALTKLQQTSDGGYIMGGASASGISGDKTQPSRGDTDFWLVKTDAGGTKLWDQSLGGTGLDELLSLQQTSDGGYILAGQSDSGISGDKTQPSQGLYDYWVIKLGAAPLASAAAASSSVLSAYPNPTSSQLTLRGPLGTPYQLLNQLGQVVRTGRVSAQALNVQALPAGLYLLRDTTSGYTTKLVKE
jgi:hypothetical protein